MKNLNFIKPSVPRRGLFFIAALVWFYAGGMLIFKGLSEILPNSHFLFIKLLAGIIFGLAFYILLFARISRKYNTRIFLIETDKPCMFSFFSGKSFMVMITMILSGIFLKELDIIKPGFFHTFYLVMGIPLFLSAIRFFWSGVKFHRIKNEITKPLPLYIADNKGGKLFTRLKRLAFYLFILSLLTMLISNTSIKKSTSVFLYNDVSIIPANKVGLVLGTSKYLKRGFLNPYFSYRINAAVELYKAGKIQYIIVSGDNSRHTYNEPKQMQIELIRRGVPKNKIFLDYAGFRTLDSVVRCKKIFGQDSFTVISQQFHNERAVYIGRNKGLKVVGYNADDIHGKRGLKVKLREMLARAKVVIDLYVTHTRPKFLGPEIEVK